MDIEALAIVFALHIEEWKYFNSWGIPQYFVYVYQHCISRR